MDYFWSNAIKIAILLNPFAVLSTFIALTGTCETQVRRNIMLKTGLASFLAGLVMLFSGDFLFSLLDISLDLFKVGGGAVLIVCAISLVWGKEESVTQTSPLDTSIAVVPLAVPMAVGPGTAAGLVIIGGEYHANMIQHCANIGSLAIGIVVLMCVLSLGVWAERLLTKTMISIITRLTGLFLATIAAKMFLEGVRHNLGI